MRIENLFFVITLAFLSQAAVGRNPDLPGCEDAIRVSIEHVPRWDVAVFGEMHGTNEAPAYFLGVICALLQRNAGNKLLVALEFPAAEHTHLAKYLESDGGEAAKREYLSSPFWQRPWKDGRTSHAMFGLIDSLRRIQQSGASIGVASIVPDFGSGDHESGMARFLDAAVAELERKDGDVIGLVLVGSMHALNTAGPHSDPDFRSMASRSKRRVTTYVFRARHGTYWACMETGCQLNHQEENPNADIRMDTDLGRLKAHDDYDWVIDLGSWSASPPMSVVKAPSKSDGAQRLH